MNTKQAVQEIGKHANHLQRERGVTLPLISIEKGRIMMRRLYYYTRTVPQQGTTITEPQYLGVADMSRGEFLFLKQFQAEWHPTDLPPLPWKHSRYKFERAEEILSEFDAIYELYDRLIPAFANSQLPITDSLIKDAKQYLVFFERHAEQPLLAYYEKFGGKFLDWVRETSSK
jgi:hypothetical protein